MPGAPHVGFSATFRKIQSRRRHSPDARPGFRKQPPVPTESGPVPADYGFRCDDEAGVLPTGPDPPSNYPEDFSEDAEAGTTMLTF